MRVATFNILHGVSPGDGRVDPGRLAEAVRSLDVDVLALQEVDRNQPRSGCADLTEVAAEAMGAVDHRFAPALLGTPGESWVPAAGSQPTEGPAYGIALLSRLPVAAWRVVRLPRLRFPLSREEPRVGLVAEVSSGWGPVTFASTHLSFVPWWNGLQLRALVATVASTPRPLLLGDLNMGTRRAQAVSGLRSLARHPTFPAEAPARQLDHVLAGAPLRAVSSEARSTPISDHCALVVDLAGPAGHDG